ncbi:MAG: ABC transporter substrate-binding protein [Planctomycetota bacterium]
MLLAAGCEESSTARSNTGIASLSPALTSIVLGLGGAEEMVAVSNYDTDPLVGDLPRVGDFINVDWEELAKLRPATLLMQQRNDDLDGRAKRLRIVPVSLPIDTLADIEAAVSEIAGLEAMQSTGHAANAAHDWRQRLRTSTPGDTRTLLVCGDRSLCAAGGTYLDELLTFAGGVNVLEGEGYLEPDDERVAALAPEVILVLLPEGDAISVRTRWERFGLVEIIERPDALVPGWNVVEIGEEMRERLSEVAPSPRDERAE